MSRVNIANTILRPTAEQEIIGYCICSRYTSIVYVKFSDEQAMESSYLNTQNV